MFLFFFIAHSICDFIYIFINLSPTTTARCAPIHFSYGIVPSVIVFQHLFLYFRLCVSSIFLPRKVHSKSCSHTKLRMLTIIGYCSDKHFIGALHSLSEAWKQKQWIFFKCPQIMLRETRAKEAGKVKK